MGWGGGGDINHFVVIVIRIYIHIYIIYTGDHKGLPRGPFGPPVLPTDDSLEKTGLAPSSKFYNFW